MDRIEFSCGCTFTGHLTVDDEIVSAAWVTCKRHRDEFPGMGYALLLNEALVCHGVIKERDTTIAELELKIKDYEVDLDNDLYERDVD